MPAVHCTPWCGSGAISRHRCRSERGVASAALGGGALGAPLQGGGVCNLESSFGRETGAPWSGANITAIISVLEKTTLDQSA